MRFLKIILAFLVVALIGGAWYFFCAKDFDGRVTSVKKLSTAYYTNAFAFFCLKNTI